MVKPIYVFTGFIDSGKTSSIKRTLEDPRFTEYEKTLILCMEEGDETYDEGFLNATNSVVEYVDFKEFNQELLDKLDAKYKVDRLFIEFNGMNDDHELLSMNLNGWEFAQMVCTVDTTKFKLFQTNMPQFMFNHISCSEIVVLNRYENADFKVLRANIKTMNQICSICTEDKNGNMYDLPVEDLFDPNNLDISDMDYGLFYVDMTESFSKYKDKPIKFNGFFLQDNGENKVIGRYAMVCCAEDTQRLGIKVTKLNDELVMGKYYHIEGILRVVKIDNSYSLYVEGKKATEIDKPEQEFVSFS